MSAYSYFISVNIALNKIAHQSSTKECPGVEPCGRAAEFALDEDKGTCTHTYSESKPWWSVDLLQPYVIEYIELTNRDLLGNVTVWWMMWNQMNGVQSV